VARTKTEAAILLDDRYDLDLILLDDGFQHRKLSRNLNILLLDAGIDLRKEFIFPLGRLREKYSSANRADILLLTKINYADKSTEFRNAVYDRFNDKPVFEINFVNSVIASEKEELPIASVADKKCFFFAGVGNYMALLNHIKICLPGVVGDRQFPDHCAYTQAESEIVRKDLEKSKPDYIITTYKDYTKVRNFDFGLPLYYLKLTLHVEGNELAF